MTNEQIVKKLADLPLVVRGSQDEVFKTVRELQEAARQVSVSLLDSDSQAADYTRPTGWQSATQRADPRVVTTHFENRECAEAFIKGLEPADGPVTAASAMRDKCVGAIKLLWTTDRGNDYNGALNDALRAIESLTLDQVKPGEM